MPRTSKDYFVDLCNTYSQVQVVIHMGGFGGVQRGNYFGERVRRTEVEVRVGKDKITGEIIEDFGGLVIDCI